MRRDPGTFPPVPLGMGQGTSYKTTARHLSQEMDSGATPGLARCHRLYLLCPGCALSPTTSAGS